MQKSKAMQRMFALAAAFTIGLALQPAIAQVQPPSQLTEDREEVRRQLFAALKSAPSEDAARRIEDQIWRFWVVGPTREATLLMEDAMARRQSFDYAGALAALDLLVELAPEWSEAWNQRAFVRFLREEYEASLEDIDRTLKLEPKHFGALAGKANILFQLGDKEAGQKVLVEAVEINPWLRERFLLEKPAGRDI
jgi:tetratricopeptide (TPR) repeat protein